MPPSAVAEQILTKMGDLNSILSKARLHLKFQALIKASLKGDPVDFAFLGALLSEVQGFRLDSLDFIESVV